jgi:formylglycine-generating enzyme required for sulfatase activity
MTNLLRPRPRLALVVLAAVAVGGCAASSPTPTSRSEHAPAPKPEPELEPFTESLSGTALEFEMRPVKGGTIDVPTADGARTVTVAPFWIATVETTWDLYDVFVYELDEPAEGTNGGSEADTEADAVTRPSRPYVAPDRGYGHQNYAAISLAYRGAAQFCVWLSAKTGRRYRLPTEAEWRVACGQGGVTPDVAPEHAWFKDNAEWTPHPVATRTADALGLHDMWGNVREWCTDADGEPIAMGGSFTDTLDAIGCAGRAVPHPDWQMTDPQVPKSTWWLSDADFMGFRVVCEPEPEAARSGS